MSVKPLSHTDIARQLALLQRELLRCARQHDWQQLRQIDRQLLALVQQLTDQALKPQFAAELDALKQQYQLVLGLARAELNRTEAQMQQFNQNKPAVLAYRQTADGRQL